MRVCVNAHDYVCVSSCCSGDNGVSFEVTVRIWGPLLEVVMQLNSWGEGLCGSLFFPFFLSTQTYRNAHTRMCVRTHTHKRSQVSAP